MGTGLGHIATLCTMRGLKAIPEDALIVEIGAQELRQGADSRELKALFDHFRPGHSLGDAEIHALSSEPRPTKIYEALGFRYRCTDIYEVENGFVADLNFDSVPEEYRGKAHVVTNFGTTEHLLNQLNAFKFIHDIVALDGFMWHILPMSDFWHHGFFKYDVNFFYRLCAANRYALSRVKAHQGPGTGQIPEIMLQDGIAAMKNLDTAIDILMRKTRDNPFALPLDTDDPGITPPLAERYVDTAIPQVAGG